MTTPDPAARAGLLDDLRDLADADAMALDELASILGDLKARAAAAPPEVFDREAIWARVERQLDRSDP